MIIAEKHTCFYCGVKGYQNTVIYEPRYRLWQCKSASACDRRMARESKWRLGK